MLHFLSRTTRLYIPLCLLVCQLICRLVSLPVSNPTSMLQPKCYLKQFYLCPCFSLFIHMGHTRRLYFKNLPRSSIFPQEKFPTHRLSNRHVHIFLQHQLVSQLSEFNSNALTFIIANSLKLFFIFPSGISVYQSYLFYLLIDPLIDCMID